MQLLGAFSGPGSEVPTGGDPNFCKTSRDPSSLKVTFKTTESITSAPAPSLQMVMVYSTSKKQKCSSTSPSSSGSHAYPMKVKTGSPFTIPNSSWRTRPSSPSQEESIINSDTELPWTMTRQVREAGTTSAGPISTGVPGDKLKKTNGAPPQSRIASSGPL
jgi:hypothetical protein